jgi:hypothetical protein
MNTSRMRRASVVYTPYTPLPNVAFIVTLCEDRDTSSPVRYSIARQTWRKMPRDFARVVSFAAILCIWVAKVVLYSMQ